MLRPAKIAFSNPLGSLDLELEFAFVIQALKSVSFYYLVSSFDHRPTWRNREK